MNECVKKLAEAIELLMRPTITREGEDNMAAYEAKLLLILVNVSWVDGYLHGMTEASQKKGDS